MKCWEHCQLRLRCAGETQWLVHMMTVRRRQGERGYGIQGREKDGVLFRVYTPALLEQKIIATVPYHTRTFKQDGRYPLPASSLSLSSSSLG